MGVDRTRLAVVALPSGRCSDLCAFQSSTDIQTDTTRRRPRGSVLQIHFLAQQKLSGKTRLNPLVGLFRNPRSTALGGSAHDA